MQTAWNSNGSSRRPCSCEVLVQHPDRLGQLITGHHGAGPAIADAGGARQRNLGVPADVERHRLAGCRAHLQPVEVVELAVEFDHPAAEHQLDDLDHLVDACAAALVGNATPLEFFRGPADPDAEAEPVVGQVGHRADLTRQQQRIARAELHHVGVEAQLRRDRAHRRRGDQRVGPRRVLVPHSRPVGRIRVVRRLLLHVEHRVGQRDRVEADFLGGLGDVDQFLDRAHRDAAGVLHPAHAAAPFPLSAGLSELTTHIE